MKTLDATDLTLLRALQQDARQSMAELAEKVALSASPCWRRVKQLEDAGIIVGYSAQLQREKLGFGVTGFVHLQMASHAQELTSAFEREVVALPQVLACHNLSGHYDYMLELIAPDLQSFSDLVRTKIRALPGVKEISTSFSLKQIKQTQHLPL